MFEKLKSKAVKLARYKLNAGQGEKNLLFTAHNCHLATHL